MEKMELKKITDNSYRFYKEGDYWVLNLGVIKNGELTKTTFLATEVKSDTFQLSADCGCTTYDMIKLDGDKVEFNISYNRCESSFSKIISMYDKGIRNVLKVKGECRNT